MQLTGTQVIERILDQGETAVPPYLGGLQRDYGAAFWCPYLGAPAYRLWEVLLLTAQYPQPGDLSLEAVALTAGFNRRTLFGQRMGQGAPLRRLLGEKLVRHWTSGQGTLVRHAFDVVATLPILTPAQASRLDQRLQERHEYFLGAIRGFPLPEWRRLELETFVNGRVPTVRAG